MICPFCNETIPDDSKYCDQCGENVVDSTTLEETSVLNQSETMVIQKASTLSLVHEDFDMNFQQGEILGRKTGSYTNKLGVFPVISSRHAELQLIENNWFIQDLQSTNSTYVNGTRLKEMEPYQINDGDILSLANVDFKVKIQ